MFASKDSLLTRPSGYNIARSVRLRSSATAYFNRTQTSGNRKTYTYSAWVKRGNLTTKQNLFGSLTAVPAVQNDQSYWSFLADNTFEIALYSGSDYLGQLITTQVFRDSSAWYHIVVQVDTTQATSSNRLKLYVNGIQVTSFSTTNYPTQNTDTFINANGYGVGIGSVYPFFTSEYFDGYQTEINFIDGQALTPSSFGETDSITGVWKPKAYSGTYGTNGFELNFSDNSASTAATIGKDYSGNGNNWTPNNISVTAGVTYDSMQDVPTLTSATAANYAVLNPLAMYGTSAVISNANLTSSATGGPSNRGWPSSIAAPGSGKWYAEFTFTATDSGNNGGCGIMLENGTGSPGESATTVVWLDAATIRQNASGTSYGTALSVNDVVIVAYDASLGRVWFGKQGTWFASGDPATNANPSATGITTTGRFATYHFNTSATIQANFGQRPFSYTPPTGFVALNTYNLPASTITNGAAYMAATLYTGTGASLTVANTVGSTSFQPDWVWAKSRSAATDHALYDSVRGVQKQLESNNTGAETTETTGLTAFGSTGFTVGALAQMNTSAATYVAWQWKAGTTSASNTNGTITSTVSAGATQGFSVVTYTHNGTNAATVGHGLGVTPSFIINKQRSAVSNWRCYHVSLPAGYNIQLNIEQAQSVAGDIFQTAPTSSVFTPGNGDSASGQTMVAYCFSAVAGYSAFGSYTGNGSTDGTFVYLGFRPKWIMVKSSSNASTAWFILDTSRDTYNLSGQSLEPSRSDAEYTPASSGYFGDILSNGFKWRDSSNNANNASGYKYIYAAFAEVPFKYALAR